MTLGTITACAESGNEMYTVNTKISDVISDPVFEDYGRLIFPVNTGYYGGDTLGSLHLTWYNYINPEKTVEIANYFKQNAQAGNQIFYDIYTEEEKAIDPAKRDTGLFLFRGNRGGKVAICNAGGGFAYVGAMQDSFPHALELSKKGYNAFALIYRPGADTATEDLARAIAFIHENAEALEIDVTDYSLWGGSAGARMAAWLGSNGTESYGEKAYPRPGAVIMQYTGHTEVTGDEPPTYNCVGTNDGIASYRTMENRIEQIKANGTDAMIEVFDGLPHGFGIGENTVAEGWVDNAVSFWERNMTKTAVDSPSDIRDFEGDWQRKPPFPAEGDNNTVTTARADGYTDQSLYLWDKDNVPATTNYTTNNGSYYDDPDFVPYVTSMLVPKSVEPKGAVLLCAGGAFSFRGDYTDTVPTAEELNKLGYQCFIVDYRLHPYTQEEGALDLERAVRFVRKNADIYRINPNNIAVAGFSAGGIQAGEQAMNFKGDVNGTKLDSRYIPDDLDKISADVAAVGVIYSFYGRLSVAELDVDKLRNANLPPTYVCYGTNEVFRNQIERHITALENAGVTVGVNMLEGYSHGFGANGNWCPDFDKFLLSAFSEYDINITVDTPVIENDKIKFSINSDADLKNIYLITALYEDKILRAVKVNETDGEFPIMPNKTYMVKVFAWERNTLKPLRSFTFDNLET